MASFCHDGCGISYGYGGSSGGGDGGGGDNDGGDGCFTWTLLC